VTGIYGTKSSDRWDTQPAKMDTLNARLIFEPVGRWDIPLLAPCLFVPEMLAAWHDPAQRATAANGGGALHFFIDDYRFEKVWSRPQSTYERVAEVGAALSPDFSMWRDMPKAMQIWQVYRSRWCAAFWQHLGVDVIPTVTWGSEGTYDFAFDGLPKRSHLAISMVGVRKEGRGLFEEGCKAMVSVCDPALVLCYGKLGTDIGCAVREYPTFWDIKRANQP
jgi:hypothetical protein